MDRRDLEGMIGTLGNALAVFQNYEGRLSGAEIRAQSLLSVLRRQLAEELTDEGTIGPPRPSGPRLAGARIVRR